MNFGCSCFWRNCWPVYGVQLVEWSRADLLFLLATVLRLEKKPGSKGLRQRRSCNQKKFHKMCKWFPHHQAYPLTEDSITISAFFSCSHGFFCHLSAIYEVNFIPKCGKGQYSKSTCAHTWPSHQRQYYSCLCGLRENWSPQSWAWHEHHRKKSSSFQGNICPSRANQSISSQRGFWKA